MGALLALFLTGLIAAGVWKVFTNPDARKRYAADVKGAPGESLLVMAWAGCILVFFRGIFVPAVGEIEVPMFGREIQIWSLGGIGAFTGWVIWIAVTIQEQETMRVPNAGAAERERQAEIAHLESKLVYFQRIPPHRREDECADEGGPPADACSRSSGRPVTSLSHRSIRLRR